VTWLIVILGLAVLVLVHEAGHFLVAKAVGMTPRKFYLGFGPPLVKRTRGGVEYGIGMLPLGGYVKIPGMSRPSPGDLGRTLSAAEQERLRGPLARLDVALQSGNDDDARAAVAELEPDLGRTRTWQELEMAVASDAYWRQATWRRVATILAGPAVNVLLAIVIGSAIYATGIERVNRTVTAVLAGHPAATAGLQPGDKILSIAGAPVRNPDTISTRINATGGKPFRLVVSRDGSRLSLGPLRANRVSGVYRVGFALSGSIGPGESVPAAIWDATRDVGYATSDTVTSIAHIATGRDTRNVSSTVGIVRVSNQALQRSFRDYVSILGFVSLALGLLNLLPLLPLDGGHILMALVERLRGRTFSQAIYLRYSAVGMGLVLLLFYIGLRNDLFSGG
jgi:regulator of sigma E protease